MHFLSYSDEAMPSRLAHLGYRKSTCVTLIILFLAGSLCLSGCGNSENHVLRVATHWSEGDCRKIDQFLRDEADPIRIEWLRLPPLDDPTHAVLRGSRVDVILGGRPESHALLAASGRLQALDSSDARPWRVLTRLNNGSKPYMGSKLALMASPETWSAEYARLVSETDEDRTRTDEPIREGVSLVISSTRGALALRFLNAIGATKSAGPSASLLPTLLAATLTDSYDELREARAILHANGDPPRSFAWMTEAPPWPPASITRMRTRPDGMALIKTLAGQIAPDKTSLTWLLNAFERVPKPIDGGSLRELDEAVGGRLAADPRFRAWLGSEWAAWASQRYRRVGRNLSTVERSSS